jgi:hypothetical protein
VLAERWLPCAEAAPEGKKPVITEVAAFARDFSPQLPGDRITIPDDLR